MTTRLELAEQKLERLKKEFDGIENPFKGMPLGQPLHMYKESGRRMKRQLDKYETRKFNKLHELQDQEKRVERLREKAKKDELGLTSSGGLKKSVENIDRWKKRVDQQLKVKEFLKENKIKVSDQWKIGADVWRNLGDLYSSQKLKEAKETVAMLEAMQEKSEKAESSMSVLTRKLIEDGSVSQWAKKPTFFFVKSLKKVALEINENGDFQESMKYPAKNTDEKIFIERLINEQL